MFIQQAYKGDNANWKVILTSILMLAIFIVNIIYVLFGDIDTAKQMEEMYQQVSNKNFWFVVNLSFFVFLLLMLFGLVIYLHKRSLVSLTTARSKVDLKRIAFSFGLVLFLGIASFAVECYLYPGMVVLDFKPVSFFMLIVLSLILFPFQIGFEEYLFRGYFMQQIGILARNRWFPLLLTSVTFGLLHSANPEVATMGGVTMIFYIGTGLFLGIMTLMDEGLELALGFHFANNFLAATLATAEYSSLRTDSLFKYVPQESSPSFFHILVPIVIAYPIILLIFTKKYKWTHWKEKLFGRVPSASESTVVLEAPFKN
ncbi:CPBP family intramembrane glutamic endopeptidase [uncultured Kordia sp.]|uniref:CPBP family intramembrane glutamic endopeptidase n=1 Tax=uncultured Kordia sp. TaxID=507699 RepID=UPI00260BFA9A|nr:CPBP family intramembrane glutamic endopeptidase [uncultured Kordia sp.]